MGGGITVYTAERPNKIQTAVKCICILHEVLAEFSGHGNSIYKYMLCFDLQPGPPKNAIPR